MTAGMENNGWADALAAQDAARRSAQDAETRKYGERVMSEFDNIVTRDREKKAEARRMKDATLSALMLHARNGDGFVPPSLLAAASRNMGFPVAGGNFDENGNFMLYTAAKGRDGRTLLSPVAIASPEMQLGTLSRAQMGIGMQRDIYSRLSERYTPSQLDGLGLRNPDAPVSDGGVTLSGGTARRLGASILGPERRGISAFGANGRGGFTNYENNADTGFRTVREDYGTRGNDGAADWKLVSAGPDPSDDEFDADGNKAVNPNPRQMRRYENGKTGEVVSVRDGEQPPWERSATSEKERIARANNAARLERDRANNAARLEMQGEKAKAAKENVETQTEATKYKADAMERIAAIRANAKGKGSDSSGGGSKGPAYNGRDLKDVVDILTNPLADEETKNAARNVLNAISSAMGGAGKDEQPGKNPGSADPNMGVGYFYPKNVWTAIEQAGQPGDNGGNKTDWQEPPNGQYRLKKNGISYHWGRNKSDGKWGYFPDK